MGTFESLMLVLATAVCNGAVTWGVVKTELQHMNSEIKDMKRRIGDKECAGDTPQRVRDLEQMLIEKGLKS